MCQKVNIPVLGVVENMSYFVDPAGLKHELFGKGGGAGRRRLRARAAPRASAHRPERARVGRQGDAGRAAAPESSVAQAFIGIAERLSRSSRRRARTRRRRSIGAAASEEAAPRHQVTREGVELVSPRSTEQSVHVARLQSTATGARAIRGVSHERAEKRGSPYDRAVRRLALAEDMLCSQCPLAQRSTEVLPDARA